MGLEKIAGAPYDEKWRNFLGHLFADSSHPFREGNQSADGSHHFIGTLGETPKERDSERVLVSCLCKNIQKDVCLLK